MHMGFPLTASANTFEITMFNLDVIAFQTVSHP